MTTKNTVSLVFAGDSSNLDRTLNHVNQESQVLSHNLKDVSGQAKAMKTTLRGAGDAAQLFGGELGSMALQAGYGLSAVKDLSKGVAGLVGNLSSAKFGLLAVTAVTIGAYGAWEVGTAIGNKLNDMLGRTPSVAQVYVESVAAMTNQVIDYANAANLGANAAYNFVAAQSMIDFHAIGHKDGQNDFLQGPVPLDAGGRLVNSTNGGNSFAAAKAAAAVAKASHVAARSVSSGGSEVAKAIKDTAQKMKDAKASLRQATQGIADSFKPLLDATSTPGLMVLGGGSGGVIGNLKKQLADTLRLKDDLAKLAKAGLSKGLLSSLTAGGLDSLPAADQLLGAGNVKTANSLSSQINAAGGSIAASEVARNAQKKTVVEINIKGGDDALKKWLRKSIKVDGAASYGLVAG